METRQAKVLAAIQRVYEKHVDEIAVIARTIAYEVKANNLNIAEMFEVQEEIDAALGFMLARLTGSHHSDEISKAFETAKVSGENLHEAFNRLFGDDQEENEETLEDIPS